MDYKYLLQIVLRLDKNKISPEKSCYPNSTKTNFSLKEKKSFSKNIQKKKENSKMDSTEFHADYVIIGAGTAANVLARLLSDDRKTSVIVIEAGSNESKSPIIRDSKFTEIEFGLEENFYPAYFWQQNPLPNGRLVNATPENSVEVNCNLIMHPLLGDGAAEEEEHEEVEGEVHGHDEKHGGENGTEVEAGTFTTGRLLGGGSSINGQQWVRGSNGYWKKIHELLGDVWAPHKTIKRYIDLEKYIGKTTRENYRGYNGYVTVRQAPIIPTTIDEDFAKAVHRAAQVPEILDYNDPCTSIGSFTRWQLTQKADGSRESSDTAFLFPDAIDQEGNGLCGRKLKVFFNTTAMRILFKGQTAIGVKALRGKPLECLTICARREVIVSAGIYSSQILQRSGVGPAPLLKCLGIPVVADNRNVGKNLQNHLIATVVFTADPRKEGTPKEDSLALYSAGAFLPAITEGTDNNRRGYQLIGAVPSDGIFSILLIALQPKSRGVIKIQSSDPLTVSLVDNNYLGDENDVQQYVDAFTTYITKIAEELTKIDPTYKLTTPTPEIIADDHLLTDYIKSSVGHSHHWVGSNSMAKCHSKGAVDPTGHVYGTKNLIVADCSALPLSPDGNTQAPAYLVGWTIAELLKEKYC